MIFIGADHRGLEAKNALISWLAPTTDEKIVDCGAYAYDANDDFNDPAMRVARSVRENPGARGVLICGTGHGMCMAANRFVGVRAANCLDPKSAKDTRAHNDANVLCLGAKYLIISQIEEIVKSFLETPYDYVENHTRRINRLDEGARYD